MKRKWIWIAELFLWLFMLAAIVGSISYVNVLRMIDTNSYHLFFKDVDGLIKGSPVRMMGMQIGYVTDMGVLNDEDVYVTFLVTQKDLKLPNDSIATVEFFGMGGSKSLEIYPPKTIIKNGHAIITTKEPMRLKRAFEVQTDISTMILAISSNLSTKINVNDIKYYRKLLKNSVNVKEYNKILKEINTEQEGLI